MSVKPVILVVNNVRQHQLIVLNVQQILTCLMRLVFQLVHRGILLRVSRKSVSLAWVRVTNVRVMLIARHVPTAFIFMSLNSRMKANAYHHAPMVTTHQTRQTCV